jgi:hypothetical protein
MSISLFPYPMINSPDSLRFGPALEIAAACSASASPAMRVEIQNMLSRIDAVGRSYFLRD